MSVNLNSNIIKAVQPEVNRNGLNYNFSADIWAIGGGGGGQNAPNGGGGGGAAFVSASLSVVPNVTWTINVGGGGSGSFDGQDTKAIIYDDTYAGITTLKAQGGKTGVSGSGGNSGTGSIERPSGTFNYTGFLGGAVISGGGRTYGGGGAGNTQNGGVGVPYDGNPSTGFAGIGGQGSELFGGIGGGGGGTTDSDSRGSDGNDGGGAGAKVDNDPTYAINGHPATSYGAGGGGARFDGATNGIGGNGSRGSVWIRFLGTIGTGSADFDIAVTNATVTKDGSFTTIQYNSGSGTFRYTAPYPYVPGN